MQTETIIQVRDLTRLRLLLQSTLTLLQAEDIVRAQKAMTEVRPSPIAVETEAMYDKVSHILGQHLLDTSEVGDEALPESTDEVEELEPIEHTSAMLAGPNLTRAQETRQRMMDAQTPQEDSDG